MLAVTLRKRPWVQTLVWRIGPRGKPVGKRNEDVESWSEVGLAPGWDFLGRSELLDSLSPQFLAPSNLSRP
jgi:hypothetical protein